MTFSSGKRVIVEICYSLRKSDIFFVFLCRQISTVAAFLVIINNVYSEKQLRIVNFI